MQRFPEKLRTLRQKHGITQQQLGDRFGFSDVYVYYLETGKRKPTAELVLKLAKFFNVTTDALLDDARDLDEG
jgi:transcriptional regulator with XRE-family HTH domain